MSHPEQHSATTLPSNPMHLGPPCQTVHTHLTMSRVRPSRCATQQSSPRHRVFSDSTAPGTVPPPPPTTCRMCVLQGDVCSGQHRGQVERSGMHTAIPHSTIAAGDGSRSSSAPRMAPYGR